MRFRRRARRGFRGKRSVGWITGLSGIQAAPTNQTSRLVTMAPLFTGSTTQATAIRLVNEEDIRDHGGEDCVLERIRGRLLFFNLRQNVSATPAPVVGGTFCRVVVVQQDIDTEAASGLLGVDYTLPESLGRDNILWTKDVLIAGTNVTGVGTTGVSETTTINDFWFDIDVVAKRKVQRDREIVIWVQTNIAALTPNLDFRFAGFLRLLLKRPK